MAEIEASINLGKDIKPQLDGIYESVVNVDRGLSNLSNTIMSLQSVSLNKISIGGNFGQEIAAALSETERLKSAQNELSFNASNIDILPPNAINDIARMTSMVYSLTAAVLKIGQIEIKATGTEAIYTLNGGLERSRSLLGEIYIAQERVNTSVDDSGFAAMNDEIIDANTLINTLNNKTEGLRAVSAGLKVSYEAYNNEIKESVGLLETAEGKANDVVGATDEIAQKQGDSNSKTDSGGDKAELGSFGGITKAVQGLKFGAGVADDLMLVNTRLDKVTDNLHTTKELQDMVYASAQRSRTSYMDMADTVAKLGQSAPNVFGSNEETVAFAELLNKAFISAGASQETISSSTLQLAQALSSGVLSGEELNSIFSATPGIIQAIADYMGVPIGKITELANQGQISAATVKNAMLSAAGSINAEFGAMPMTWGQVWVNFQNQLLKVTEPILKFINYLASNWETFEPAVIGATIAIGGFSAALAICNGIMAISNLLTKIKAASDQMAEGKTLLMAAASKTATGSQIGLNSALLACPLTWIILAIIAVVAAIYTVVAAINKLTGSSISATGLIMGALATAGAFIWNLIMGVLDIILGVINTISTAFAGIANFIANVFKNPISSVIYLFQDLADVALSIIETIANALDNVFGTDMAGTVAGWREGLKGAADKIVAEYAPGEDYKDVVQGLDLTVEDLGLSRIGYQSAFDTGYDFGEGLADKVTGALDGFDFDDILNGYTGEDSEVPNFDEIAGNVSDIADNTEEIKNSEDIADLIKDYHARQFTQRSTTQYVTIDMSGQVNNIASSMDVATVTDRLVSSVRTAIAVTPEGA